MATNYTHPGLYIEELPGPHTIQGAPTSVAAFVGVTESSSAATAPYNAPTLVTSWNDYQKTFGSFAWGAFMPFGVFEFFTEGGAACYVVRVDDRKRLRAPSPTITLVTGVTLSPASIGAWASTIGVVVQNPLDSNKKPITTVFNLYVVSVVKPNDSTFAGSLLNAYVAHNSFTAIPPDSTKPATTYTVLESFTGLTSVATMVDQINNCSIFIRAVWNGTATKLPAANTTPTTFSPATQNVDPDFAAAYNSLESIQGISLIAMPDTVTLVDTKYNSNWNKQQDEINLLLKFCEDQQNLFYAVDPPFGLNVQDVVCFKTGQNPPDGKAGGIASNYTAVNSPNGAMYHPWIYVLNPATGNIAPIPPSGPALGKR